MKTFIFSLFIVLLLSGCDRQAKSVQYFKEHNDERKAKIKECLEDASKHQDDEECKNATRAQIYFGGIDVNVSAAPDGAKYQKF